MPGISFSINDLTNVLSGSRDWNGFGGERSAITLDALANPPPPVARRPEADVNALSPIGSKRV